MLKRVDAWIFDTIFQKIADKFEYRYGRTHFWLAATCLWCFAGCILIDSWMHKHPFGSTVFTLLFILTIALLFDFEDSRARQGKSSRNLRRDDVFLRLLRLVFAFLVVRELISVPIGLFASISSAATAGLELAQAVLICSGIYFSACNSR